MSFSWSDINLSVFFFSLTDFILKKLKLHKNKTHDFTELVYGSDYAFEVAEDPSKAYMTAQRRGVKTDDYIVLLIGSEYWRYQVEQIDYYSNPPDMWMALIKKITDD